MARATEPRPVFQKVIDLSHTLYEGMPEWPTHPPLRYGHIKLAARDLYTLTLISQMTTHTATHVDAPAHFIPEGKTLERLPIEKFVGHGVVLDVSHKRAGEEIGTRDLHKYAPEIRKDEVVLLYTGWDRKRGLSRDYLFMWPHLGIDAARYLASKRIRAVGIDTLSVGGWADSVPAQGPVAQSSPVEVHKILLSEEIVIIEEVANLGLVLEGRRSARAFFIFAPLKLVGAEGGPCRMLALV